MKGVPKSLSNIEGLRLEDLGQIQYDAKEDVYVCCAECDDKAIAQQIQDDIHQINKELAELEEFQFGSTEEFSVFPGR